MGPLFSIAAIWYHFSYTGCHGEAAMSGERELRGVKESMALNLTRWRRGASTQLTINHALYVYIYVYISAVVPTLFLFCDMNILRMKCCVTFERKPHCVISSPSPMVCLLLRRFCRKTLTYFDYLQMNCYSSNSLICFSLTIGRIRRVSMRRRQEETKMQRGVRTSKLPNIKTMTKS